MPTTQPVTPLPIETLLALCHESLHQATVALQRATAEQFPLLATHIRAKKKRQLHTLLLLDRRASRADVHCALHALAHIRKPWIIDTHWQASLSTRNLPTLHGVPAARLLHHLYRAILLGHAPHALFPSRHYEHHQLLSLHLAPSPAGTALLDALSGLRARIEAIQHPRRSHTTPVAGPTLLGTIARGRNRWFRATHSTCKLETARANRKERLITYTLASQRPGQFPPIYIEWSLADAQAHAHQLLSLLRRTAFRINRPMSSRRHPRSHRSTQKRTDYL
ncbi:MAG: hypothetical protein Q8S75_06580 [Nitrospirota bacterium]|nr:hypothetical protein [Nitrospirota bacterium]